MALSIYTEADEDAELSSGGTFTNPLAITFDGRSGGSKEVKLYIRNNSSAYYYTDISLRVVDESDNPIIDDPDQGFSWKISQGDDRPSVNDWKNIAPANVVSFSDIGEEGAADTSTYLPFWLRIQLPPNLSVQVLDDVKLVIQAEETIA